MGTIVYIIYTKTLGVYLGNCFGLGFWSKLDRAGQDHAPVFETEGEATDYMSKWEAIPKNVEIKKIKRNKFTRHIPIDELTAQGISI